MYEMIWMISVKQCIKWSGWWMIKIINMIQLGRIYKIAIDQNDDAVLDI